ncbi:MAG: hypothetical protein APR54_01390 [Candidatus Cloacimonas sp. SDB]|nr:MAG: hypothetical protein APR54_01390 [Candidatus Cloacimonas sp. SDB]
MKNDNPVQIIPVFTSRSNSFFIRNSRNCLMIDTGMPGQTNLYLKVLKQHHIAPPEVDLIIITHTHYDHCGNVAELKQLTGAQVMVHADEAENMTRGYTSFPRGTSLIPQLISSLANLITGNRQKFKQVKPDIILKEKYDLNTLGFDGYVLPTPGHTAGSLCIILKDEIAFVGDTMFNIAPGTIFPPFANQTEQLKRSWYKLIDTGAYLFYPGHGKPFEIKKLQNSLKKL